MTPEIEEAVSELRQAQARHDSAFANLTQAIRLEKEAREVTGDTQQALWDAQKKLIRVSSTP